MQSIHLLIISVCIILQTNSAFVYDSPLLFDRFGHVRCKEEVVRLDNYIEALKGKPDTAAIIIGYGGRNDTKRNEIVSRLLGIKNYLIKSKISNNRIIILNGGYREELNIELWILPNKENATLLLHSTIRSQDVRFKKGRANKLGYKCKEVK
ncbi:MAG: hypothetical protein JOZ02_10850 [Acidobacteria bacterium]|nr:hypothetical protein [Acidobacteriota bacterium]